MCEGLFSAVIAQWLLVFKGRSEGILRRDSESLCYNALAVWRELEFFTKVSSHSDDAFAIQLVRDCVAS